MDCQAEMKSDSFCVVPVGYVVRKDAGGPESVEQLSIEALRVEAVRIVVKGAFAEALLGLAAGDDILVLCYLDRASQNTLRVHPRGDQTRPLRGVFATRSPARPNPISVTTARILSVVGTCLEVVGLDALDGSPVLDIKPHSAYFDEPYRDG